MSVGVFIFSRDGCALSYNFRFWIVDCHAGQHNA